jgi:hypothetical protein
MLTAWTSFFALTGTSAAALTGLMFVVLTLVTGSNRKGPTPTAIGLNTFSTPTVLHFATALLASAVLSAPWNATVVPATILGLTSAFGVLHMCRVIGRTIRLDTYRADLEDWTWFNILPLLSYVVLLIAAVMLPLSTSGALYAFGAGILLQLFIGIHNAWDIVTYLAVSDEPEWPTDGATKDSAEK